MSTKEYMIHKGKATVTEAAVTHAVIDPETGEEVIVEDTPAREHTITLAAGSRFGDDPINRPVLVRSAEHRKALAEKGFESYEAPKSGKAAEALASREVRDNGLAGRLSEIADRDRERALERVRRMPGARRDVLPQAKAADEKAPDTLGADPKGGK